MLGEEIHHKAGKAKETEAYAYGMPCGTLRQPEDKYRGKECNRGHSLGYLIHILKVLHTLFLLDNKRSRIGLVFCAKRLYGVEVADA